MSMKKFSLIFLKVFGYCFLAFITFFISNGIYENIYINKKINEFISMAVYEKEENIGNTKVIYYKVSRETFVNKGYETYERPTIWSSGVASDGITYENVIGSTGDILLNKRSPYENIPFVYEFITFFFGGHAVTTCGLKNNDSYDDLGINVIEVAGNTENTNYVLEKRNDWFLSERRSETIGVRLKGITKDENYQFMDNLKNKFGQPYNYTFLFNTKKSHYCTDLLNKGLKEVNKKYSINDWFYVSVNDIINSNNTYISFYKYNDGNITYVYYLG